MRTFKILTALFNSHIYEEVAHIYNLNNKHQNIGLGMIGELPNLPEKRIFRIRKRQNDCGGIRHSSFTGNKIKKSFCLGGAGSFAISNAIQAGWTLILTAD
jgi:hypothetical protein